ncbi:glycoside hydrolase family 6 protein [Cellulosimicrobium sp. NPDC057862]|uniref:glycoside hydrolase family 6 protein n=1 Tax=Cellulosimicrobium sp. NPDC057862 TaxID=3346266 RepID=UPI00366EA840
MRATSPTRRPRAAKLVAVATLATLGATATAGAALATSSAAATSTACTVDYRITSSWSGGFQADVTVTNLGAPRSGWELAWDLPAGESIGQLWNGTLVRDGGRATVGDVGWNASLATGGSASFGLVGTAASAPAVPASFTLDGVACGGDAPPDPTDPTDPPETPGDVTFHVDETNQSWEAWQAASGSDRDLLAKIALTPQSSWVTDADAQVSRAKVAAFTSAAAAEGATPLLTVYAIPGRDCGSHSGGGTAEAAYRSWVQTVASGIVGEPWVVLEPDALAQLGDCSGQGDRVGMLRDAARILTDAGARVYVDAGHSAWLSPATAAARLQQVGLDDAVGFALNTSNYRTTAESRAYGEQVAAVLGGDVSFVVDTSRNGNGSNGEWCNPRGRALGEQPRAVDDGTHLDALLWVKLPGESDGSCNGGPPAGQWWQEVALELARNASW